MFSLNLHQQISNFYKQIDIAKKLPDLKKKKFPH